MLKEDVVTRGAPFRLSWGAIFAGVVLATALWLLLMSLGWAIGISALKPTEMHSLKGVGLGTGLWSFVAPILALFVASMVAARSSGFATRVSGAIHGSLVWGLSSLVGFFMLSSLVAALVGGAAKVGGAAVNTVTGVGAASGAVGDKLGHALGLNADDMLGPINERLAAEGKQQVTAEQLKVALKDATTTSIREGRMDREVFLSSLADQTSLSRSDVDQIAGSVEQKLAQAKGSVAQAGEKAADITGGALWVWFGSMFLSLLAAIGGAVLGVTRRQRDPEAFVVARPGIAIGPGREVYP